MSCQALSQPHLPPSVPQLRAEAASGRASSPGVYELVFTSELCTWQFLFLRPLSFPRGVSSFSLLGLQLLDPFPQSAFPEHPQLKWSPHGLSCPPPVFKQWLSYLSTPKPSICASQCFSKPITLYATQTGWWRLMSYSSIWRHDIRPVSCVCSHTDAGCVSLRECIDEGWAQADRERYRHRY